MLPMPYPPGRLEIGIRMPLQRLNSIVFFLFSVCIAFRRCVRFALRWLPPRGEAVRGPARGLMRGELPWPPVSGMLWGSCPSSGPAGPPAPLLALRATSPVPGESVPRGKAWDRLTPPPPARPMHHLSALCAVCVAMASPSGGGSCPRPRPRTDEGRVTVAARKRDVMGKLPLIRPCGATFPQRGRLGITPPPARPMHHLQRRCARPWCAFRCPAGSTRWQSGHRRLQCPAPRRAGCPCRPAAPAWP